MKNESFSNKRSKEERLYFSKGRESCTRYLEIIRLEKWEGDDY